MEVDGPAGFRRGVREQLKAGADGFEHAYAVPDDVIPEIARRKMYCVPTLSVLRLLANQFKARGPEWDWKVKKYVESEEIFRNLRTARIVVQGGKVMKR